MVRERSELQAALTAATESAQASADRAAGDAAARADSAAAVENLVAELAEVGGCTDPKPSTLYYGS
jgi:hypothetical protein